MILYIWHKIREKNNIRDETDCTAGVTPFFIRLNTYTGNVVLPGHVTNIEITTASKERTKDRITDARSAGITNGRVTCFMTWK